MAVAGSFRVSGSRVSGLITLLLALAAGLFLSLPAMAQKPSEKDLRAPPKLPKMAAPSKLRGSLTTIDEDDVLVLDLSTGGRVRILMREDVAPKHAERIKTLVKQGFYDGTVFHRVIEGFMAQGGDPTGTGTGGSELPDMEEEFNDLPHVRGAVAMARAQDKNSANSQFYIVFQPVMKLDRNYTIWGRVISGMQWVDAIARGEPPENPSRILKASLGSDNLPPPDFAALPKPVETPATTPLATVTPGIGQ
ncbi:peptidylprolyl isomerase [Polymorphobacter sp.]|uniref:peptidylprolyl isomerase n=1 Tax=Polymorphobacter sp. TaxID=1909290 RepID=UPI003F6FE5ED